MKLYTTREYMSTDNSFEKQIKKSHYKNETLNN